jgi:hypothetical protein
LNSHTLRKQFEEKLSNLPGDESYFLLTTFANMAMARSNQDYEFVRATTIDLFQVTCPFNIHNQKFNYNSFKIISQKCIK